MPSSLVREFTDPDEYGSAIRHSSYDLTVTQRGAFSAKLTRIDLHRLWMQHNEESSPRIAKVQVGTGRVVIGFLTNAGPDLIRRGIVVNTPDIVVKLEPGDTLHHVLTGGSSYGTMSLPIEDVEALGSVMMGRDLAGPEFRFIRPAPEIIDRVQRLHAAAKHLAEYAPSVLTDPEAAHSLEQEMIEGMITCLGSNDIGEDRAALRRHATIMQRFLQLVDECTDQPIYLPEACRNIGASERTLRACCQEHFGMSPKHYLMLRRMHLARRTLRKSIPGSTTVTEIAIQYGFWQLGRFAGEYQAIFGETPSATLRSPV